MKRSRRRSGIVLDQVGRGAGKRDEDLEMRYSFSLIFDNWANIP